MRKTYVVLGGAGFIGFHTTKGLLEAGKKVIAVDNFLRGERDHQFQTLLNHPNLSFFERNALDLEFLIDLIPQKSIVFNLVALNGTENFYRFPFTVVENSAGPAITITKACAVNNVDRLFYFGSSESYAGGVALGLSPLPTPENVPLVVEDLMNPRWSYAGSKTLGEIACVAAHHQFGIDFTILRIHNVFGSRMGGEHAIPEMTKRFRRGDGRVYGSTETRSFLYVKDLVQMILKIDSKSLFRNEVVNLGDDVEIEVMDLACKIRDLVAPSLLLTPESSFVGSVLRRQPDVSKLRKAGIFTASNFEESLRETVFDVCSSNPF